MASQKLRLGAALVKAGLITQEDLKKALEIQRKTSQSLGYVLVSEGFIDSKQLLDFFNTSLGVPHARLDNYVVDETILNLVPKQIAEKYKIFPLLKVGNNLDIAMVDPFDSFVVEVLEELTGCKVRARVSLPEEIERAIKKYYYKENIEPDIVEKSFFEKITDKVDSKQQLKENDAPIIALVDKLISRAIEDGASDIHIEPDEKLVRVRYRLDGILHEVMTLSKQHEAPIVSRIKIMGNMDIAEKRVPQDGRAFFNYKGRKVDLRLSTFPTVNGEKVVIRILDKSSIVIQLEQLGFSNDILSTYNKLIRSPNGIILVTGPTGSGKSTTLYASLMKINSLDKNIVTIEDPVEYKIGLVNQSQVNPKAGYDFANGLRSILRQDPDVVMVGEIRDVETAEIAIRAALTGHLVFSTLHTNDSAGAVTRLIDMGVEPFLVASSIVAVMAQRLVRKVCPFCKEEVEPSLALIENIKKVFKNVDVSRLKFYRGNGCQECKGTGYKGRVCINELFVPDEELREMIVAKEPSTKLKKIARKKGMRTLREDGILKVAKGITTMEEVLRVTQRDEEE